MDLIESSYIGQKLFSDILFEGRSDTLQSTNSGYFSNSNHTNTSGGNYSSSYTLASFATPKSNSVSIWQTSPTSLTTVSESLDSLETPASYAQYNQQDTKSLTSPFGRSGSFSKKNTMNPNAQSYIPNFDYSLLNGSSIDSNYTYQTPKSQNDASMVYQSTATTSNNTQYQLATPYTNASIMNKYNKSTNNSNQNTNMLYGSGLKTSLQDGEIEQLKSKLQSLQVDLNLKKQVIETLNEQVSSKSLQVEKTSYLSTSPVKNDGFIDIPIDYLHLFHSLNSELKSKTNELNETKERLESIITSISINPQRSTRNLNGDYNEEEIGHKIVTKLQILQSENENLLKMISSSNKMTLIVEIGLLKEENERLTKELGKQKETNKSD